MCWARSSLESILTVFISFPLRALLILYPLLRVREQFTQFASDNAYQVFPMHVTEQLRDGEKMIAESHECALIPPIKFVRPDDDC